MKQLLPINILLACAAHSGVKDPERLVATYSLGDGFAVIVSQSLKKKSQLSSTLAPASPTS
jgi:hypothetical protein